MADRLAARAQVAQSEYQALQTELETTVQTRQKLGAQLTENQAVQKEFSILTTNNTIYKQIGPVLVQQDQAEAKANVNKRIEYIESETKRIEARLKELETKLEAKKLELVRIQTEANGGQLPEQAIEAEAAVA